MGGIKQIAAKLAAQKERIAILVIGLSGNKIISWIVNYVIDPFLVAHYGLLKGGFAVIIFSFFICLVTIVFYDWAKKDWLGIEMIKEMKECEGMNYITRVIKWILRKGDNVAFVGLSILTDPFITLIYFRKGANRYNGMGRWEWKIFFASILISNLWWVMVVFGGIQTVRIIFE